MNKMSMDQLQRKPEDDFIALCVAAARVSGGSLEREKSFSFTRGSLMSWYDKVFDFQSAHGAGDGKDLYATAAAADLAREMILRARKGEIPGNIFLRHGGETEALEEPLIKAGYEVFYAQTGMVLDRSGLRLPDGEYSGIRRVDGDEDLKKWIACLDLSFDRKRDLVQYRNLMAAPEMSLWGLYDGSLMVSTILLFERGETAGIHLVSTHPEHRKKGHGARLTAFAAERAFSRGAEQVVLLSSLMGEGVYAGLGFVPYGRVKHLRPRPL